MSHPNREPTGVHMTTETAQRSLLIFGASQLVLNDVVAGLRALGYHAEGTNDFFSDIAGRVDLRKLDLVSFGGQVPPDRKAELRQEISAVNPHVIFIEGLAGIPGLVINQVQGAFAAQHLDSTHAPIYAPDERTIQLALSDAADVKVTAWWMTSTVPPDPKSDSLVLLDDRLAAGDHTIPIPDHIPPTRAFATVQADAAIHAFSIATE